MQPQANKQAAAREVREYMTADPQTLDMTSMLLDAVLLLRRTNLRHIPILDGERLVGILSERDVARVAPSILAPLSPQEYNRVFEETPIEKVMTRNPVITSPSTPLVDALRVICENRFGCLPVVEDERVVGIITKADMLRVLSDLMATPDAAS